MRCVFLVDLSNQEALSDLHRRKAPGRVRRARPFQQVPERPNY